MKSSAKQPYVHTVSWINPTPRYPAGPQIDGTKCKISYNSANGETLAHVIEALRDGSVVRVHGLHRLGDNRRELAAALKAIRDKGAKLYDTEAQAYVDVAAYEAIAAALGAMQGEARMPTRDLAVKRGSKGGRRTKMKVSEADARKLWKHPEMTVQQKSDAIGLSKRACYDRFGTSGRVAGWPTKKR